MSGVTDCYQPPEKKLELTRRCLTVMWECRQPVSIVTKSRLILRDLDALAGLASVGAARVAVSLTTLDPHLARLMEPRASAPADRIEAIRRLSAAGVPTAVMVAPVIPGLTDREMPRILEAAAGAGASSAGYVLLRLPHQVKTLFLDWLESHYPQRARHVQSLLRQSRGGKLYDAAYSCRMKGEGEFADQIGDMFKVFRTRFGLDHPAAELSSEAFGHPQPDGQMMLF
jgi:DNA repair photolyase